MVIRRTTSAFSGCVAACSSRDWRADQIAEPGDELGQAEQAGTVEGAGQVLQLPQVGQLAVAEELELRRRVVAGVGEDGAEQPGDRQPILQAAPALQVAPRPRAPARAGRPAAGRRSPRRTGRPTGRRRGQPAEHEQRLVAQAAERRPQHAGQADAVLRVLQGAEQIQEIVNLLLGEEGPAADEVVIEAVPAAGPPRRGGRCSWPGTAAPRRRPAPAAAGPPSPSPVHDDLGLAARSWRRCGGRSSRPRRRGPPRRSPCRLGRSSPALARAPEKLDARPGVDLRMIAFPADGSQLRRRGEAGRWRSRGWPAGCGSCGSGCCRPSCGMRSRSCWKPWTSAPRKR